MKRKISNCFCFILVSTGSVAFIHIPSHYGSRRINSINSPLQAGGGFGGGFGGNTKQKGKKTSKGGAKSGSQSSSSLSQKKKLQMKEKLIKSYGGDIAKGTEQRVQDAMKELPPHIQEISELYRKVKRWNASMESLSVMQQSQIPPRDLEGAKRARAELDMFYEKHGINEQFMHNIFQQITWDASADAKAVQATIGKMPDDILKRVNKACSIIADNVKAAGRKEGRCLDVGCGHGTLIPNLTEAGIYPNQITGVDLSPEMIRNAEQRFRGPKFIATDFLQYDEGEQYDGIIFCSSLHDLPDMKGSVSKASELLRANGRIVIMHAQGATHVLGQVRANPILVKRGLPNSLELNDWAKEMNLAVEISPYDPGSEQDLEDGYLAVLLKKDF